MPRYQPTWCQDNPAGAKIAAAAGAKMPRYQPSWCQDIKIPSRARPSALLTSDSLVCREWKVDAKPAAKQSSWCQDANISAKLVPR